MNYEFDPSKDESNLDKHGVSLADADGFEWETAMVREDTRKQYAELRFEARGYIGDRLPVCDDLLSAWRFRSRHQSAQSQPA